MAAPVLHQAPLPVSDQRVLFLVCGMAVVPRATSAGTTEIIIAKITPLFLLLMVMVFFAIGLMKVAFDVPFRGSLPLVVSASALCVLCGIGIGTVIATFTKSAQQSRKER